MQQQPQVFEGVLSTPLPPPHLIELVNGHTDQDQFDASRRAVVPNICKILHAAGCDMAQFQHVLDFGCGCGRALAGWESYLNSDQKLFGCDINEDLVAFCQRFIPYAVVKQTGYYPPLPWSDSTFDFVFAGSVFTHLSVPALSLWAGELARVIKPDGIALISTHGSYYHAELAARDPLGPRKLSERGYHVLLHGRKEDTWEGSNYYATWITPERLRNLMAGFRQIHCEPGVSHGPQPFASYQDITLFRRLED